MSDTGSAHVIVATGASRIRAPEVRRDLIARIENAVLRRTGRPPVVTSADDPAGIRAAAIAARDAGALMVVAVGGDGSVREIAEVVRDTGIALAIVPGGTGNLFAATLRIARDPATAAGDLESAQIRTLDAGEVAWVDPDGRARRSLFLVACGTGFDARVMGTTNWQHKRRWGVGAYFAAAARESTRLRPFDLTITVDGIVHRLPGLLAFVANAGELVPGVVRPRRALVPDDGLLDILVVRGPGPLSGIVGAVRLLVKTNLDESPDGLAARFQGRRVEISSDPPEPIQIDGDVAGTGPFTVDVLPGALRVAVPSAHGSSR